MYKDTPFDDILSSFFRTFVSAICALLVSWFLYHRGYSPSVVIVSALLVGLTLRLVLLKKSILWFLAMSLYVLCILGVIVASILLAFKDPVVGSLILVGFVVFGLEWYAYYRKYRHLEDCSYD